MGNWASKTRKKSPPESLKKNEKPTPIDEKGSKNLQVPEPPSESSKEKRSRPTTPMAVEDTLSSLAQAHYIFPNGLYSNGRQGDTSREQEAVQRVLLSFFSEEDKALVRWVPSQPYGVVFWRVPLTTAQAEIIKAYPVVSSIYPEKDSDYDPTEG